MTSNVRRSELTKPVSETTTFTSKLHPLSLIAKHGVILSPREQLQRQGSANPKIYLLQSGWLACSITLKSGARQIINVHLPGEIIGLPNLGRDTAIDAIHAVTGAQLSVIEPAALSKLFVEDPRAAAELYLHAQVERANSMAQLAIMGRADALNRMAGLILQMMHRIGATTSSKSVEFDVPLTQEDIADLIGLTNVHVNRVIRQLRERGLATWAHRRIVIYDLPALHRIADFTPEVERDLSWLPDAPSGPPG